MMAGIPQGGDATGLLSSPDEALLARIESGAAHPKVERSEVEYTNNSSRFSTADPAMKNDAFRTQFAQIYYMRLIQMKKALRAAAASRWGCGTAGNPRLVDQLLEIKPGERCAIVGTLYKEMSLKPNILDEHHAREKYEAPPPSRSKYHSPDDSLVLEDQSGRVALQSSDKFAAGDLVTGVVVAVLGHETAAGEFLIEDVCFHQPGPQQGIPEDAPDDVFVALISGLCVGPDSGDSMLPLQMFIDYVSGELGSVGEQVHAAKIARVIIAGNIIEHVERDAEDVAAYKQRGIEAKTVGHMRELDDALAQLTTAAPVDVMPGSNDPSNLTVPQQPMHRCMFPRSASSSLLRGVTNPYDFSVHGANFLGTSGQGVDDIYRFSAMEDRHKILASTLAWGHLFPTAPDTLPCFPFFKQDPFVIDNTPHVYFAGNQPSYSSELVVGPTGQQTRIISIPTFATTMTAVIVNTRTLESYPISFGVLDDDTTDQMEEA